MRKNGTLTYLHSDHLGGTVLKTNTSGNPTANQQYYAYDRQRGPTAVTTAPKGLSKFTGQQLDATGLQYYQSRYYDPREPIGRGTFVSAAWGNRNTFYQSKNGIELCSLNPVYFLPFVGCRCRQVGPSNSFHLRRRARVSHSGAAALTGAPAVPRLRQSAGAPHRSPAPTAARAWGGAPRRGRHRQSMRCWCGPLRR